jgi:hypothetical protein
MTLKHISILVVILTVVITCFARLEQPITRKPSISLVQAEAIANKTISEKYKDYFCIGARFAMLGEKSEEWELIYANSKRERKSVTIDNNGKATLHEYVRDL